VGRRYDASDTYKMDGLHFVGGEAVSLSRYRDKFYSPKLLAECLGRE
jgi:hypothetical protein